MLERDQIGFGKSAHAVTGTRVTRAVASSSAAIEVDLRVAAMSIPPFARPRCELLVRRGCVPPVTLRIEPGASECWIGATAQTNGPTSREGAPSAARFALPVDARPSARGIP